MKNTLMKTTLGILALGLMVTGAQANWDRNGHNNSHDRPAYQQSRMFSQQIDARQDRQMARIRDGMRNGRLTRAEFRGLMQEQHKIRALEQHFRADGIIDAREFRHLDHRLDVAGRNIRAEKQDYQAQSAYGHPRRFN
jgi:uncharacterized membrane protein YebE (DUF533 family)